MRSGWYKLIDKVNHFISLLAKRCNLTVDDYVRKTGICNVMKTSKLQCLLFMYNIMLNFNCVSSYCLFYLYFHNDCNMPSNWLSDWLIDWLIISFTPGLIINMAFKIIVCTSPGNSEILQ